MIPKEPTDSERFVVSRHFAPSARVAFGHLLATVAPPGGTILLPAYIGQSPLEGSGIGDPIDALGLEPRLYRVGDDLQTDLDDLERHLASPDVAALVVVHWFGFPDRAVRAIAALCRHRGVPLIEDCAHCIESRLGPDGLGTIGDYGLFSLHKVLPVVDGGYLRVSSTAADPGPLPSPPEAPRKAWEAADRAAIARRRVANYSALIGALEAVPGVRPLLGALAPGVVPLNLPVIVEKVDRFEVYKRMRARDIGVVALYHTLHRWVDEARFPTSHAVSRRILNLPIHQDVRPEQITVIAEELDRALRA